jgi:hypothetical protein
VPYRPGIDDAVNRETHFNGKGNVTACSFFHNGALARYGLTQIPMNAKRLFKILVGTLAGTSALTSASYKLSELRNKQFREPELINSFLKKKLGLSIPKDHPNGWIIHFIIGGLFLAAYDKVWSVDGVNKSVKTDLLFGTVTGLIGVAAWKLISKFEPKIKALKKDEYYVQLFISHIIFSLASSTAYGKKIEALKPEARPLLSAKAG